MEWSQDLALGEERMDTTHREFVSLVNAVAAASDEEMLSAVDALIAHTEAHFGQENRWMEETQCPTAHCHLPEHAGVLGAMQEVRNYVMEGKAHVGRVLAQELDPWFRQHAATMDNMLAHWLREQRVESSCCEPAATPTTAG